jgi:hypothetical protein
VTNHIVEKTEATLMWSNADLTRAGLQNNVRVTRNVPLKGGWEGF